MTTWILVLIAGAMVAVLAIEVPRGGITGAHGLALLCVCMPALTAWSGLRRLAQGSKEFLRSLDVYLAACCGVVAISTVLYGEMIAFDGDSGFAECMVLCSLMSATCVLRSIQAIPRMARSEPNHVDVRRASSLEQRLYLLIRDRSTVPELRRQLRFLADGGLDHQIEDGPLGEVALAVASLLVRRNCVKEFLDQWLEEVPGIRADVDQIRQQYRC